MSGRYSAARRFYHAVYRWHNATSHGQCCRQLSSTPSWAAASSRPFHRPDRSTEAHIRLDLPHSKPPAPKAKPSQVPGFLRTQPVQTSSDKPFDTFREWDEVVRYRSEAGLLLQWAIPPRRLDLFQRKYGPGLQRLRNTSGANIELGSISTNYGVEVLPVTFSGSFEEVAAARQPFSTARDPSWLYSGPYSETETPSKSLGPDAKVLRELEGDHRKVEVGVLASERAQYEKSVESFSAKYDVELQLGDEYDFLESESSTAPVRMVSVYVGGAAHDVLRTITGLPNIKPDASDEYTAAPFGFPGHSKSFFRVLLRLPLGPKEYNIFGRVIVGKGGSRLAQMARRHQAKLIVDHSNNGQIEIVAQKEAHARSAQRNIEDIVRLKCENDNLPPMQVQEIQCWMTDHYGRVDANTGRGADNEQAEVGRGERTDIHSAAEERDLASRPAASYRIVLGARPATPDRTIEHSLGGQQKINALQSRFDVAIAIGSRSVKISGPIGRQVESASHSIRLTMARYLRSIGITDISRSNMNLQVSESNVPGVTARQAPSAASPDDVKIALRALSHPVVLVTSYVDHLADATTPEDALPSCRGVTVSSFNSVTLTPTPIISFNIRTPSRSWEAISTSKVLVAHILDGSPEGAALAHAFTLPYKRPDEPFQRIKQMGASVHVEMRQQVLRTGFVQAPRVQLRGAVSASLVARLLPEKCVQVGDHVIVVAEVSQVEFKNTLGKKAEAQERAEKVSGLTYAKRGYRSVGEEIIPIEMPDLDTQQPVMEASMADDEQLEEDVIEESSEMLSADDELCDDLADSMVDAHSSVLEDQNPQTLEEAQNDYFEAIDRDDFDISEADDSQPNTPRDEGLKAEEEEDSGITAVQDSVAEQQTQPLAEDSAAAQDEKSEEEPERVDSAISQTEGADEDEKDRKRSATEAGSTWK